jgi:hypothetical protein
VNDEEELRARFESVPVPPGRIEMEALLGAARRRAFRRRSTQAAGGVALATGLLLGVPLPPKVCSCFPHLSF